jgi:putative peptidoglycan lipid II flippase
MILSAINNQSKTVTGAALIIATATLVSRLVGLFRDRILAHYFGAGQIMDAYYAAFKIPDLVYTLLIVGALTAGFIPTFTKIFLEGDDKSRAWKLANNILNITGAALVVLAGLGIVFAPRLLPLIAPGFSGDNLAMAILFARIMFLSPIFLGLSMTLGGILQSLRRFVLYSIAPIFYNLGIIFGASVLTGFVGPLGLAWGVVLGAALHLLLQIIGARNSGWRYAWQFNLKDKDTRLIGKLMLPRTIGSAVSEINILITTILASLLPIGSIAVFNYASNLQAVPVGIIGIPFALAIFPVLSAAAAKNDMDDFVKNLSGTIRLILFLIIPLSIIVMLLRAQIVRVVLGTGAFDWTATINTADTLAFFAFGLFAQALIPLFARAFYSLSDTKTPLLISVVSEICAIAAALVLMRVLGVAGLALASSIGALISLSLFVAFLRRRLHSIDGGKILHSLFRISVASIIMAVTVQALKYPLSAIFDLNYFWGVFGQGAVAGIAGLLIYGAICWILKVPEMIQLKDSMQRRFFKAKNVETTEMIDVNE